MQFTSSSAVTATVPAYATVAFPVGATIAFEQHGAGTVTIAAAAGVTLNHYSATLNTAGQYAVGQMVNTAQNVWTVFGALS